MSDSSYQGGAILSHGSNPTFNLIEGNYIDSGKINFDHDWGSATWNTVYKNKSIADTGNVCNGAPCTGQRQRIISETNSTYTNIVGNVVGSSYETEYCTSANRGIILLNGCANDQNIEFTTSLVHANYDYYNNAQLKCSNSSNPGCHGTNGNDLSIANSLYLASKPSWMCQETTWPPVNPATPSVSDIPAKRRYDGNPCGAGEAPPQVPQGFTVGPSVP
jgi:hypothetical protein